jgi:hypothetical protein
MKQLALLTVLSLATALPAAAQVSRSTSLSRAALGVTRMSGAFPSASMRCAEWGLSATRAATRTPLPRGCHAENDGV